MKYPFTIGKNDFKKTFNNIDEVLNYEPKVYCGDSYRDHRYSIWSTGLYVYLIFPDGTEKSAQTTYVTFPMEIKDYSDPNSLLLEEEKEDPTIVYFIKTIGNNNVSKIRLQYQSLRHYVNCEPIIDEENVIIDLEQP